MTPTVPPEPAHPQSARTQAERGRQLQALARYGQPLGVAAAAVLAFGFWISGETPWLGAWVALQLIVLGGEALLDRAYDCATPAERESPRWERRLAFACLLLGMLWAALPLFMMPHRPALELVLVITIVGSSTGTLVALGVSTAAFWGFVVPQMLGLIGAYLLRGQAEGQILAALLSLYLFFLVGTQRMAAARFVGHVTTQARNQELVDRLQRAEIELSRSLVEHKLLFDLASVGIAEIRGQTIVRANARLEQLLGYANGALNGLAASVLYPAELTADKLLELIEPLARGEAVDRDLQVRRRDGSSLWVALACRALEPGNPRGGVIAVLNDITDRREREAAMYRLAHEDGLTGLPNRRLLEDRLRQALLRLRRHGGCVALMLIDLDGFKRINDVHGHEAGDLVLSTIGRRLLGCVRVSDTVSRLGGDEFVVMLDNPALPDAAARIAHELVAISAEPIVFGDRLLQVGASIGISAAPHDSLDAAMLLHCADAAMYRAKQAGRGVWRAYSPLTIPPALHGQGTKVSSG